MPRRSWSSRCVDVVQLKRRKPREPSIRQPILNLIQDQPPTGGLNHAMDGSESPLWVSALLDVPWLCGGQDPAVNSEVIVVFSAVEASLAAHRRCGVLQG